MGRYDTRDRDYCFEAMNYLKILETRMREIEEQIMRGSEDDPCAGPPRHGLWLDRLIRRLSRALLGSA